jgi:hypothetical protein
LVEQFGFHVIRSKIGGDVGDGGNGTHTGTQAAAPGAQAELWALAGPWAGVGLAPRPEAGDWRGRPVWLALPTWLSLGQPGSPRL